LKKSNLSLLSAVLALGQGLRHFWIKPLGGTFNALQKKNLAQKIFELHAWVKKCHFGNFSERAGMTVPC
jgi:hypothetical protein